MKRLQSGRYIRHNLSMSQQDFADFLGITRSLLSMYEQGLRSLPTPEMIKIGKLEAIYHDVQKVTSKLKKNRLVHNDIQKLNDKIKKSMQFHAQFCKQKSIFLRRELNEMIAEHNKATLLHQLLENLLANAAKDKTDKMKTPWIEMQQRKLIKKMIRYGDAAQAKLQAKIMALQAEGHAYKKMVEKIN
jgi:transcriptional regulator with XRE-family HTH domain